MAKHVVSGVITAVCLSLAACTGTPQANEGAGESSVADEPTLGPISTVTSGADIRLPLSQFNQSESDIELTYTATQILKAKCAARFGVVSSDQTLPEIESADSDERRYGILDLKTASTFGYRAPSVPGAAGSSNDKDSPSAYNPDEQEFVVMTGTRSDGAAIPAAEIPKDAAGESLPSGGCASWAHRELTSGKMIDYDLINQLSTDAGSATETDSRVQQAWAEWSTCMSNAGYDFKSPWEPNNAAVEGTAADPEEIATAIADVNCRTQTNLVGRWMAVETAYQNRAISQHEGQFHELQALWRSRIDTAKKTIASGSQ